MRAASTSVDIMPSDKGADRLVSRRVALKGNTMMARLSPALLAGLFFASATVARAADIVPTDIMQPGTQPNEVTTLESPDKCDNCHGGYDAAVEPAHNWRGSMMSNAGRDPLFWATLAVAEQDFDGAGDLCIRCHSAAGWVAGRSTPTDGSGLNGNNDASGVQCDFCHEMTNPDDSEHLGEQFAPFVANDGGLPATGYYGSGMYVLWGGSDKLGPYDDAQARHQFMKSLFHRSEDFCGTCHDVSNPAVGDLAPNNGAQVPLDTALYSGVPGAPVEEKAAFNNFPYAYGIVERTYSEYKASPLSRLPVAAYTTLPAELQAGALAFAYDSAVAAGTGGDYADNTERTFTCQSCHLPPVSGVGCNKRGAATRSDLPLHDMTGGNYWAPEAILYLDARGLLRLGGGMTAAEVAGLIDGAARARDTLARAASLAVTGNTVRVVNLTGHKLISGYPEGRRMWLRVQWYDANGNELRLDGAYGDIGVTVDGVKVQSLLDLEDPFTKVYEAHYGMTQAWAARLVLELGYDPTLPLSFDRFTGAVVAELGDLAAEPEGTAYETFHFVLNNTVVKDNRIPPYQMSYAEARARNALPVPEDQYLGTGGVYEYFDDFVLQPPSNATYATIELMYQPTSWEYIQFLALANSGANPFLADEGANLLEAWLNTGMAEPAVIASTFWGEPGTCQPTEDPEATCDDGVDNDCDGLIDCEDADCDPVCAPSTCNGDGICGPGEDCLNCPTDCAGVVNGKPSGRYCCGNGVLEPPEGDGSLCDGNP